MKNMLKKIDKVLILIQENICAMIFLFIFVMCLLQIFFRNIVYLPVPWTEEFARVGLIYLTFFGAAVGLRNMAHPSVDFFTKKLPLRPRKIMDIVAELLVMAVSVVFIVYGGQYVLRMVNDHSTTYYYSKSTWYYAIPVAGMLMTVYGIRNVCYDILAIVTNREIAEGGDSNE